MDYEKINYKYLAIMLCIYFTGFIIINDFVFGK